MNDNTNNTTKAPCIAVLGTGSDVGKSVIAAALCRIFSDQGLRVAPYKAQNMSNNSGVTPEGLEMG
ncbi:MAG: cobyric acid synthase, partial [Desulfosarcina sp.]|nr:cobyric acid synthase [Desulfosarcina sp.]